MTGGPENSRWTEVEGPVCLEVDSVGVWRQRAELHLLDSIEQLDEQSRERALRLRRPLDRATFVAAHLLLNQVIADQLGVATHQVVIDRTDDGRPIVPDSSLQITLSHATPLLLVAVSTGPTIGIDVEHLDPRRAAIETASVVATPAEVAALSDSLSASLSGRAESASHVRDFYEFWTAKEAWAKAAGTGLDDLLQYVTVWPPAGGPPPGWFLHRLCPWPDAAATLLVGGEASIHYFSSLR